MHKFHVLQNVLVISKEAMEFDPEAWFTRDAKLYSYDCITLRIFFVFARLQDLISDYMTSIDFFSLLLCIYVDGVSSKFKIKVFHC
jgi:phosphate starvation-inducible membrane PsiE